MNKPEWDNEAIINLSLLGIKRIVKVKARFTFAGASYKQYAIDLSEPIINKPCGCIYLTGYILGDDSVQYNFNAKSCGQCKNPLAHVKTCGHEELLIKYV